MLRVFLLRGVSWQGALPASGMGNKAVGMSVHLRIVYYSCCIAIFPGDFF